MEWLLDHRRWLAGDAMTLADFAAAAHLSCLDYISDVDWTAARRSRTGTPRSSRGPPSGPLLADHVPGFAQPPHYATSTF
jgi:glutathione S-transferase